MNAIAFLFLFAFFESQAPSIMKNKMRIVLVSSPFGFFRMMVQPGGKRIPMRVKMNNKSVETMISEGLIRYVDTGSEDALKTLPEDAVFRRNRYFGLFGYSAVT